MLEIILGALLPVVVTLLLGALAGWRGDVDVKTARTLNTVVLVYALPLMLFSGTVQTTRAGLAAEIPLAGALLAGFLVPFAAALLLSLYAFRRDLAAAALTALSFGFPAVPFTGMAILSPLIGGQATAVVAWSGAILNLMVLPATLVLLAMAQERHDGATTALRPLAGRAVFHALKEPVVFAPLLGFVLVLLGIRVPGDVIKGIDLLGTAASGLALFSCGAILQAQGLVANGPALASAVGRVLVVPSLAWLALLWGGADAALTRMVVPALALAVAPLQVILAARYRTEERENAAVLLYSNVLCIPALALFILILSST